MLFFLQMFVILAACRLCGWLVRRWLHQPQVIGEMIAGVVLGPSLLGAVAPGVQHFLFPPESKPVLYVVAQVGIALLAIVGGAILSAVLIFLGPRIFAPLGRFAELEHAAGRPLSPAVLAAALMLCTLSAYLSDVIGLHAVFGAFLIGTAMPRGVFAERLRGLLEPFTLVFLLPVFFTYSGLHTQLAMVNTPQLLGIALGILAISIFAKFVACWAAALATGADHRSALGIGALMNARGLTELIIVNIGLTAGVIGTPLFSMLVLMAIVTTLMASPLFELVYGRAARARGELPPLRVIG